jgi:putative nucleotidyltransferase with HDIG domain
MITKKKISFHTIFSFLLKKIKDMRIRRTPAFVTFTAFLILAFAVLNSANVRREMGDLGEFEAGKVAERDITVPKSISYLDEKATNRLIEEQKRLTPAVFRYDPEKEAESLKDYGRFVSVCAEFFKSVYKDNLESFHDIVSKEFPNFFPPETLDWFFHDTDRLRTLESGRRAVEHIMKEGIFLLPQNTLFHYNPAIAEISRRSGASIGGQQVSYDHIITADNLRGVLDRYLADNSAAKGVSFDLLKPFLRENVFFSQEDTDARTKEAADAVKPVFIHIEQGQRIIKKGFVVSEEDMAFLHILSTALLEKDFQGAVGRVLLLLMFYALFVFIGSIGLAGRKLSDSEIYLLTALTCLYIIGALLAKNFLSSNEFFPVSILLPTALVIMIPSILIGEYLALAWAFILPSAGLLTGFFDLPAYFIALASGIVASYTLKGAEKRMDLVKAGLIIAGVNCLASIAVLLVAHAPLKSYPLVLFWSAFNGVASGMLVLGVLPPLEQVLSAATTFRLIELSDLNAPIIKRLFTIAPGTYSHSFMVAQLAEAACQEIGANSLLARVGAYYHDIGKMEQPEYFVENQSGYNKHDDIPPRLSATILRSHVKLGVEKARAMGLPKQVIDIIGSHHGNSLIQWFYNKALEQEKEVSAEDFSYPGSPPHSREAAVVMLADVSEAATRTLEKKTAQKIEEFIQNLINSKLEHGQLVESELAFRDLETIKKAFVRVLASYYHSRIEYPKEKKKEQPPQNQEEARK